MIRKTGMSFFKKHKKCQNTQKFHYKLFSQSSLDIFCLLPFVLLGKLTAKFQQKEL